MVCYSPAAFTSAALLVVTVLTSRLLQATQHCPVEVVVSADQFPLDGFLLLLSSNASVFLSKCNEIPLLSWKSANSSHQISLCSFKFSRLPLHVLEAANRLPDINWMLQRNSSSCQSTVLAEALEFPFETAPGSGRLIFNTDCVCYNHDQNDKNAITYPLANISAAFGNYSFYQKDGEVIVESDVWCPGTECTNGSFNGSLVISESPAVVQLADGVDSCTPDRCQPNGVCVPSLNGSYFCQCQSNYCGDHCQYPMQCDVECSSGPNATCKPEVCTCYNVDSAASGMVEAVLVDPCDEHECLNNSTCVSETNGTWSWYECQCRPNFTGKWCESVSVTTTALPMTSPSLNKIMKTDDQENETAKQPRCDWPCLSGSRCVARNRCDCPKYYLGANCGFLHTCLMYLPCQNGGECVILGEEKLKSTVSSFQANAPYSCSCKSGWTGQHCDTSISSNQCMNDGLWNATLNRCICHADYGGEFCQTPLASLHLCITNESLCGSNGICIKTGPTTFKCDCTPGFHGTFCDLIDRTDSSVLIVGAVLGALCALGLLIGTGLLARYLRRSRELKGKYNPAKEEMKCATVSALPLSNLKTGERLI